MQLSPSPTLRRTKASSWPAAWASSDEVGSSRMTSRSGASVTREGARHLDHLAPADREVADDVAGLDAVAGEDRVELRRRSAPPARRAPAEAAQRRVADAGVLGDGEVRAERQLLEHAAYAERVRALHRVGGLGLAADRDRAAVGRGDAGEHVHQRRLAGAVVADEADALAGRDREVDAVERPDGAEMLLDAVQRDDPVRGCRSSAVELGCRRGVGRRHFMLALIAAIASSWVYSWLATPPSGIVGSAASKSSWVKAR